MLKITGLSKTYPQRGIVLDHLDLDVKDGETVAVTGPSGSGKTTLLNLIGLLDLPDSGEILFDGKPIIGFSPDEEAVYRNKNIGFVFQEHLLMPHLTIYENIILPLLAGNYKAQVVKEEESYCLRLMEEVGIAGLKNKYPFEVSGGEAQRASLVRALACKPSILLADEPTGALDQVNKEMLADLLIKMNNEFRISVIVATHSNSLAEKMSRRLKLEKGKLSSF